MRNATLRNALIFFVLVAAAVGFVIYQLMNEVTPTACAPDKYPMRCYRVQPAMCEALWAQSEKTCTEKIRKLNLPPTRLIGPMLMKCQVAHLDQATGHNRITGPDCDEFHKELDAWKMRNPDLQ